MVLEEGDDFFSLKRFFEKIRETFTKNLENLYSKTIRAEKNADIIVSISMLMLPIGRKNFISQEVSQHIFSIKNIAKICKGSFSSSSLM